MEKIHKNPSTSTATNASSFLKRTQKPYPNENLRVYVRDCPCQKFISLILYNLSRQII